jgi:hypothetical protein
MGGWGMDGRLDTAQASAAQVPLHLCAGAAQPQAALFGRQAQPPGAPRLGLVSR